MCQESPQLATWDTAAGTSVSAKRHNSTFNFSAFGQRFKFHTESSVWFFNSRPQPSCQPSSSMSSMSPNPERDGEETSFMYQISDRTFSLFPLSISLFFSRCCFWCGSSSVNTLSFNQSDRKFASTFNTSPNQNRNQLKKKNSQQKSKIDEWPRLWIGAIFFLNSYFHIYISTFFLPYI